MYDRAWGYVMDQKDGPTIMAQFNEDKTKPGAFFRYVQYALREPGLLSAILEAGKDRSLYYNEIEQILVRLVRTNNLRGLAVFLFALHSQQKNIVPLVDLMRPKIAYTSTPLLREGAWGLWSAFIMPAEIIVRLPDEPIYLPSAPSGRALFEFLSFFAKNGPRAAYSHMITFYLKDETRDDAMAFRFFVDYIANFKNYRKVFPNLTAILIEKNELDAHALFMLVEVIAREGRQYQRSELSILQVAYSAFIKADWDRLSQYRFRDEIESFIYDHLAVILTDARKQFPHENKLIEESATTSGEDRMGLSPQEKKELYVDLVLRLFLTNANNKNGPRAQYWFDVLMALPAMSQQLKFLLFESSDTEVQSFKDFFANYQGHKQQPYLADLLDDRDLYRSLADDEKPSLSTAHQKTPNKKQAEAIDYLSSVAVFFKKARPVPEAGPLQALDSILKESDLDQTVKGAIKTQMVTAYEEDKKNTGLQQTPALQQAVSSVPTVPAVATALSNRVILLEKLLQLIDRLSAWVNSFTGPRPTFGPRR